MQEGLWRRERKVAREWICAARRVLLRRQWKLNLPKINLRINESDAVNIAARVFAKMADEADFGFAAGVGDAYSEGFVGRKFVAGEDAGTVTA